MKITRRDALKAMTAGYVGLQFSGIIPNVANAATKKAAAKPADLAVIKGKDPAKNVRAAVDALGGMGKFVKKGDKVVVKPNIGFGNKPEEATTTTPEVVKAVVDMAIKAGAKQVLVLDYPCHNEDIALDISGIKKAVDGMDKTFCYAIGSSKFFKEVKIPKGVTLKKVNLAKDIIEADTIINVPTAKSHSSAKVSFGMKNWMGVIENRKPFHVFHDLHQAIADLATIVKPKLTILDATRSLVTGGPGGPGDIEKTETIVAGVDPLAVDVYGLTLAKWGGKGYNAEDVPQFKFAKKHGIGEMDVFKLKLIKRTI